MLNLKVKKKGILTAVLLAAVAGGSMFMAKTTFADIDKTETSIKFDKQDPDTYKNDPEHKGMDKDGDMKEGRYMLYEEDPDEVEFGIFSAVKASDKYMENLKNNLDLTNVEGDIVEGMFTHDHIDSKGREYSIREEINLKTGDITYSKLRPEAYSMEISYEKFCKNMKSALASE